MDHVVGLAAFPGFAELKRSLRERPQLRGFGVSPGETGIQEDWHAEAGASRNSAGNTGRHGKDPYSCP